MAPAGGLDKDGILEMPGVEISFVGAKEAGKGWRVREVALEEGLSSTYCARIELSNLDGSGAAHELLGRSASLTISSAGVERVVHGIVELVETDEPSAAESVVRIRLVPALAALSHSSNSRIFQDTKIEDVVKVVMGDGLKPFGRSLAPPTLARTYGTREYVVQHRETDLAFVTRLLAEEGLWYYFKNSSDGPFEQLVICDSPEKAPAMAEPSPVDLSERSVDQPGHPAITNFNSVEQLRSTKVQARQFDWTNPKEMRETAAEASKLAKSESNHPLGRYEHGDIAGYDYKSARYGMHDTKAQAHLRLEEQRTDRHVFHGKSNVVLLQPGHYITVKYLASMAGPSKEEDTQYLVVQVMHEGNMHVNGGLSAKYGEYSNSFVCIRRKVPYRPERMPKPRIAGIQTATVVDDQGKHRPEQGGPQGHELATDEYGRVRVKFHWDVTAPEDKSRKLTTSSWLRVAQSWAGANWGSQFVPRVGMEVVVQFIDGDPDQPLITGCVYNGEHLPPYAKKPLQSGIKTRSATEPERYNELRFDDTSGHEQIYVRAQKDQVEEVLGDHTTTVTGKQTQVVKQSQSESVHGNASLSVGGKRTTNIGGEKEHGEETNIKGERKTTVSKAETQTFQDTRTIAVTKLDTLTVDDKQHHTIGKGRDTVVSDGDDNLTVGAGHKTTVVKQKYTIKSEDQFAISQGAGGETKAVMKDAFYVETQGDVTLTNQKTTLQGGTSGKLKLEASEEIKLVCGQASLTLKKDGTIELTGLTVSAGTKMNNVKFDAAGATLSAMKITSAAKTLHEITGLPVKIN